MNPSTPRAFSFFGKSLGQEQWGALDFSFLVLIVLLGLAYAATSTTVEFLSFQDMGSYRKMAEAPSAYFTVVSHHAQRVLPSLVVWSLNQAAGLSIDASFRLLSAAGYLVAHALLYMTLRQLRLTALMSLSTVLMAGTFQWPMGYLLRNVWQACDAWTYALSIAFFLLALKRNVLALCLLGLAGVFVRQNLPIIGLAVFLHLALDGRSFRPLWSAAPMLLAFVLNTIFAGGGAAQILKDHLTGGLVHLDGLALLVLEYRLPLLTLPFLPFFFTARGGRYLRDYWWIALFSLATIGQALLVAKVGGIENSQRLILPAIWILIPVASLVARDLFVTVRQQALYAATPLTLLASRFLFAGTDYHGLHAYRLLPALYLCLLIALALLRARTVKPTPP